jgi:hypothetical protein
MNAEPARPQSGILFSCLAVFLFLPHEVIARAQTPEKFSKSAFASQIIFDARIIQRYNSFEISLAGQNFRGNNHAEFGSREISRGIFEKITWQF